MRMLVHNKH